MGTERVVITGFGLFTPIGETFWHTMLSLRAKRSSYQGHETVLVADSPSGAVLRGATISRVAQRLIPRDLSGAHRVAALLAPAVAECLSGFPAALTRRLAWEVVTRHSGTAEIVRRMQAELLPEGDVTPVSFCQSQAIRCEFFTRIACAAEALQAGRVESVLVSCADSLCDPLQLAKLLNAGLLKDAANPHGIMAGEAGGSVLLERESTARRRGAAIMAVVAAWGGAREPHPWPTGSPSTAQGLTGAFHQAFSRLDDGGASVGQVITDENGERPRALEWALTAGRIFPDHARERILRHPAVIVADAGGALAAVVLADALARLAWRRPPRGRIALSVSDDQGERRVLCLQSGDCQIRRSQFTALRQRLRWEKRVPEEI
jgi:3-oxoacyl-[acyl-carrier-protein] synthase I